VEPGRFREENVVLKVDVFVEVVFEFFELLIGDHERVADIVGDRILLREMTNFVSRIADLVVFATEFLQAVYVFISRFAFRPSVAEAG
jgi:hypothetical protein